MWGLLAFIGVVVTITANLILSSVDTDIEKVKAVCLWLFGVVWILAGTLGVHAYNSKRREHDLIARMTRELYELRSEIEDSWTFGDTYIWEGEKKCILIRDPICRICGKNPSVEVHHIRPKHLKGNPVHPGNLIGLCLECHDEVHRRIDKGIQKAIDESLEIEFAAPKQKTLEGYDDS